MSQDHQRRSSYGPESPLVGERGERTRQAIVTAAHELFAEQGFHLTNVEDIARRAQVSRATLYQYFESKNQIFVELVAESGGALMRVVRRLGPLGPDGPGFDNLHWWLGEWAWVVDRYAAMFIQWAIVNSPQASLRPDLNRFVEAHTNVLAKVLTESKVETENPTTLALLLLAVVERFNYMRQRYRPPVSDEEMLRTLAIACQLALFPDTPDSVLRTRQPSGARDTVAPPATSLSRPSVTVGPPVPAESTPRFAALGRQGRTTARTLLDAAADVFAGSGYTAATVDQIVATAGVSRGTFYKYFEDKQDLMRVLAAEASAHYCAVSDAFAGLTASPDRSVRLRTWLADYYRVQERYAGVLRAWMEGPLMDPEVMAYGEQVAIHTMRAFRTVYEERQRRYPTNTRAGGLVLVALLGNFPEQSQGSHLQPGFDEMVEASAVFVERALLDEVGVASDQKAS